MAEFLQTSFDQFRQNTWLELIAVVLAIAYLLLAMRQHIACWYAAFVSTGIFLYLFFDVKLYMESGLQVFYLIMAVYGWWHWQKGDQLDDSPLPITTWSWQRHVAAISFIAVATIVSGTLLQQTDQRLAYLDSFTTWSAIVTTFMVAWKVLENWIYWFIIDGVSIYLYLDRELYFTALLFMAYVVIVIFGFRYWLADYQEQANQPE